MISARPEAPLRYYPPRAADHPWWDRLWILGGRKSAESAEWVRARLPEGYALKAWWGRFRAERDSARVQASQTREVILLDPVIALGLSVVPGLGHLFVEGRGIEPFLFFVGTLGAGVWAALFPPAFLGSLPALALLLFHQWVMVDGFRRARRLGGLEPLTGAAMVWVTLAAAVLAGASHSFVAFAAGDWTVVRVDRHDLAPRLREGDRLLVRPRSRYQRGDIVFSRRLGGLERVLAVGGDEVKVVERRIYVNGTPLDAASAPLGGRLLEEGKLNGARLQVPPGSCFVLFSARSWYLSADDLARYFVISQSAISGRLEYRYHPDWEAF